jgi:Tol biopolymer transport system component
MPLTAGDKLGPYSILDRIGAGGMGDVYKAHDPRMGRDVAIKVSRERFGERFSREVRAIAALNHPNICTLYDVGPDYLVMELVEGPTLAERIKEGPVPLEEALAIARQIAAALEHAHEKGIVHRDLKPGNVKIKPGGPDGSTVKVLDFGLAKMGGTATPSPGASPEQSPTISMAATQAGVILGTAAYMSPEQARGQAVDKRADIWAFGVVLCEMLTGKRVFTGDTVSDILAAVLVKDPPIDQAPARVRPLLRRCLERDPNRRLHDIADARLWLEDMPVAEPVAAIAPAASPVRRWLWPAAAIVCLLGFLGIAYAHFREKPPAAEPFRLTFAPPSGVSLSTGGTLAVSPDGRRVLYTAAGADGVQRIYVRSLDAFESRVLTGTEGVVGVPFWSYDSRYIAFGDGAKLKKIDASGGPPQTVCDWQGLVGGGYWTAADRIVFGTAPGPIFEVAAGGGTRTPLTAVDRAHGETFHAHPFPLPDGKHFLYVRSANGDAGGIYVGSLDAKPEQQDSQRLLADQASPVYVPPSADGPGRLLFLREGTLMGQPFDASSLKLSGDAVPLVPQVASSGRFGVFSVSSYSVLAYRTGAAATTQLTWYDRSGKILGSPVGAPGLYASLALSPDGNRVAAVMRPDAATPATDLWLIDLARGANTRFTFDPGTETYPVWSPDGGRIIFSSSRTGIMDLYQKPSNGSGAEDLLFKSGEPKQALDWSRDGRFLLFTNADPKMKSDLWFLPLEGDRKPLPFVRTEFNEAEGQFSPDGKWVAYSSDESGRREIYVQPFPPNPGGGRWVVSNGGGAQPRWRRDGKELFFLAGNTVMATEVTPGPVFKAGVPKPLFAASTIVPGSDTAGLSLSGFRYDVSADGQRFLLVTSAATTPASNAFNVVLNWQTLLKR